MSQLESKSPSTPASVSTDRGTEAATFSLSVRPLAAERLYRPADLSSLSFETTADIEPVDGLIGQHRALDAIEFGTRISKQGFNLFVIGPGGMRVQRAIAPVLQEAAAERRRPSDWVYVNNFADPHKPVAIELPAGRAGEFRDGMHSLIDDLKTTLPAVFDSEDYQTKRGAVDQAFQSKQAEAFLALHEKAAVQNIIILRTPMGFALAPAATVSPFLRTSSEPGQKRSARKFRKPSNNWKKSLNMSYANFRNGRRSGATNFANSIVKLRDTQLDNLSTRQKRTFLMFQRS